MTKKSQMEILGLAIVIVLVLLAMTFTIGFFKQSKNSRQGYVSSEIASNMINTFLKTNAPGCSRLSMTELIQDCFQSEGLTCDNGQTSCEFVDSKASEIMRGTLDEWHVKYQFLIYMQGQQPKIDIGTKCETGKSKQFPVPSSSGTIYVKLDVCT